MSDHALKTAVQGRYLASMQHGQTFMDWRKDGEPDLPAGRQRLVTAGALLLLLGIGCLALGAFAGIGPASEGAVAAPAAAAPGSDPLVSGPLTTGQDEPTDSLPPTPVSRTAKHRAPKVTTPTAAPKPSTPARPAPTPSVTRSAEGSDCGVGTGSGAVDGGADWWTRSTSGDVSAQRCRRSRGSDDRSRDSRDNQSPGWGGGWGTGANQDSGYGWWGWPSSS
jgi:hypothetical protein